MKSTTSSKPITYRDISRNTARLRLRSLTQLLAFAALLLLPQAPLWAQDSKLEAADIDVETQQDEAVTIDVLTPNDTGEDNKGKGKDKKDDDDLALDSFTQPENGVVTDNDDGTLTYTPNTGFNGKDSFTYTIRKDKKASKGKGKDDEKDKKHYATGTVTITVIADDVVNSAPVITSATSATATEDIAFSYTATATDADGDAVSFIFSGLPAWASASGATVSGTPLEGDGNFTFNITASDGNGGSDNASVSVTVTAVNDAPVITSATTATAIEDIAFSYTATASDEDGDAVTFSFTGLPAWASASGATVSGTPREGDGDFTFNIAATDGNGGSDNASVSVTVKATNDAPVADAQSVSTSEDQAVAITLSGSDVDGDALTFSASAPANGSLSGSAPNLTYTPNADFNGSDSFTFTVNDGTVSSTAATVSIAISAVNDVPVANNDAYTVAEDSDPVVLDVLANDFDADGDVLTIKPVKQANGIIHILENGDLTYEPTPNFSGPDEFIYAITDGFSDPVEATVTVNVTGTNDAPVITSATTAVATEDIAFSYTATATDADGDAVTFSFTGLPAWASASGATVTGTPGEGDGDFSFGVHADDGNGGTADLTVNVTVTGVNDAPVITSATTAAATEDVPFSYTATATDVDGDPVTLSITGTLPAWASASGATLSGTPGEGDGDFSFGVHADDGNGGTADLTVNVTVTGVNDAPVITSSATAAATEDVPFSYTATATDVDGDPVTLSIAGTLPAWASASGATLSGTPGEGDGDFSFGVHADDGNGGTADLTVNVTVTGVNDAPVITSSATGSATEDVPFSYTATATDAEGDNVTLSITGTLPAWASASGATVSGTPGEGDGDFSFGVHADDGNGGTADLTVNVTVSGVNDAPIAEDQSVSTGQDESVAITLSASDVDGDQLTYAVTAEPDYGTLDGTAPDLTYTPAEGFSGSDAFTFTANDGNGGEASAQVTIYINVNEVAVSEEVDEDGGTVTWDSDGTGDAVTTITVPDGAVEGTVHIEISLYLTPPEGAELTGPLFFFGPTGLQFDVPVTITVPYDPDLIPDGVSETDIAVLRYDEAEGTWTTLVPSTVDTVNHTVSAETDHFSGFGAGIPAGTNHAPVAVSSLPDASIDEDESFAVIVTDLTAYFSDADPNDQLSYVAVTLDAGLDTVFISDGNLIAIPSENFFGIVRIRVTVSDGSASITADLDLTINPVNDAPVMVTIADLTLVEDTEVWIPLSASDVEGDAISFSAQSDTSAVVQQVFGDTTLLLVPMPNWVGTANITLTATDALGASESSEFAVSFTDTNDPPEVFSLLEPVDAFEVLYSSELIGLSLDFSWESSSDPDGDSLAYIFVLEDAESPYMLRDTVGTSVSVPYADLIAIMDDLGVNNLSLWWSIWAIAGPDSIEAVNGPFEIIIIKSLAVESDTHLPQMFALHQNYPNPFNPVTTLRYEMPAYTKVNITIYDLRGRKVVELVDGYMHAGYNKVIWNSADALGRPVSSGIYFARMATPEYTHTIKMSLIK